MRTAAPLLLLFPLFSLASGQTPRARDVGVPFEGTPGTLNAITDVAGVEVGHTTLISGEGALKVGVGPVRTGVTALLPRGKDLTSNVAAGIFSLNGNGEMTGSHWINESGVLEGPIMITNTHSVGVVRDAVIRYRVQHSASGDMPWALPLVAETWDGRLNDLNGFHVTAEHVFHAIDSAHGGAVDEGSVGGGTGMVCNGFKGGIGTASRKVEGVGTATYTVGVLVQCNYGARRALRIAGVPVGRELPVPQSSSNDDADQGSIIIVVATDAPLVGQQCQRLARRAALGIGRNGGYSGNGSGDLFIAFSTANPGVKLNSFDAHGPVQITVLPNDLLDPLFEATVQATEEAIVNAMIAAKTMTGVDGHTVYALPHDQLRDVLRRYNRLNGR